MDQNQNEQQSNENEATKCLKDLMTQYLIIKKEERKSFLEEMPSDVVNKVRALKKIQLASIYLDADFHKEVYQVERKYEFLQREAYYKRFEIINGMYEPNEVECSLPENIEDHIKGKSDEENLKTQGIPNFWLTVIKNCPELCSMIKTIDVPILEV